MLHGSCDILVTMPTLPVIADCYRVTIPWIGSTGPQPRNVFHVTSASSDVLQIGADIGDAFHDARATAEPFVCLSDDYLTNELEILPLDGATATVTCPIATSLPGVASGQKIPQSCMVMSFHTPHRGARGRGRMYIGPITESCQDAGLIDTSKATEAVDAWGLFITALATKATAPLLVVASYVHADVHTVTSLRADAVTGTQRRRVDQLR